jgi:uncharacterized protein YndB with AHSA1/START domain
VSKPVIEYRDAFHLDAPPGAVWVAIERFDQYEKWWHWLSELSVEGDGLQAGSVLHGVVSPPVPYRMCIDVTIVASARPRSIEAVVSGDLVGPASLRLRRSGSGTAAEVAWTIEMMQLPMRMASRVAHPLLQWGHDRVVQWTIAGFARRTGQP